MTVIDLAPVTSQQCFLLHDVSWSYYQRTLDEFTDRAGLRITFDHGRMEMMTVGGIHEFAKGLIRRLIEVYALEADISVTALGSVTCRREDLESGLEPDECYYVATPHPPLSKSPLNLDEYPPPDLAVEIDVTNSSIPKVPIYGALGVPEVWRFDGEVVISLHRRPDGSYFQADESLAFPNLSLPQFNDFLRQAIEGDQHTAVKAFRDWVRAGATP